MDTLIENRNEIERHKRDHLYELKVYYEVLFAIADKWKTASYVQKHKIAEMLFVNIIINRDNTVTVKLKPDAELLFEKKSVLVGYAEQTVNIDILLKKAKSIRLERVEELTRYYLEYVKSDKDELVR